jgi:hypothetical protein
LEKSQVCLGRMMAFIQPIQKLFSPLLKAEKLAIKQRVMKARSN